MVKTDKIFIFEIGTLFDQVTGEEFNEGQYMLYKSHNQTKIATCKSSIVGGFRAGFLGVCRDVQRGVQASTGCWGCAGMCRGGRKPPQGAALISMRERRALIGQTAYVHPVTYAIAVL